MYLTRDIDGLVQDCGISSALAMEILHSCTKPSLSYTSMIYIIPHDADKIKQSYKIEVNPSHESSNKNSII